MDVRYAMYASLALVPILAGIVRDRYSLKKRMSEYLPLLPRPQEGQPVLLIPGLFADDTSLVPLAAILRQLGYRAETWGCGTNTAKYQKLTMQRIVQKISLLHRETGMQVVLIGHSLGGLYAVCAAHTCGAKRVRSVITIGSPVNLDPDSVNARTRACLARVSGKSLEEHLTGNILLENVRTLPPGIPVTTIATQRDTIVGVDSCRYRDVAPGNRYTEMIVSEPGHHGMIFYWLALMVTADRAKYGEDNWEPFDLQRYSAKRPIDHLINVYSTP